MIVTVSLGERRGPPTPFYAVPLRRTVARITVFSVLLRTTVFRYVSARPGRWVVDEATVDLTTARCR